MGLHNYSSTVRRGRHTTEKYHTLQTENRQKIQRLGTMPRDDRTDRTGQEILNDRHTMGSNDR